MACDHIAYVMATLIFVLYGVFFTRLPRNLDGAQEKIPSALIFSIIGINLHESWDLGSSLYGVGGTEPRVYV